MTGFYVAAALIALGGWAAGQLYWNQRYTTRRLDALDQLRDALLNHQRVALDLARTCDGYLVTDHAAIEAVAISASGAMQARSVLARCKCEADLSWALARLQQAVESHSDLQQLPAYEHQCNQLVETENQVARQAAIYNQILEPPHPWWRELLTRWGAISAEFTFDLDPHTARESMRGYLRATAEEEPQDPAQELATTPDTLRPLSAAFHV